MGRLAEALRDPQERDEAAEVVRSLIERVVLTPGAKRGEMAVTLHGDLGAVLEWTAKGAKGNETDAPSLGAANGWGRPGHYSDEMAGPHAISGTRRETPAK